MLHEIIPDASWSNYDLRNNPRPYADEIIGSANAKSTDLVTKRLKDLSLSQPVVGKASTSSSTPTQSIDVHFVQSSTNPNGNQQPGGNKRKGRGNNRKGGKNKNKSKDGTNNDRSNNNASEGKKEKKKVNFPCKIFKVDLLAHLFPKIEEASRLLSQPHTVLTNPFPHNQHMASGSTNIGNASSGSQNPSIHEGDHVCFIMVKSHIDVATRSHDYGSS
jgi:hypothetical protein